MFATQTTSVIRPEFQLIEVTNPNGFEAQNGTFVPCGTIYARLFFPAGCVSISGTVQGSHNWIYNSKKAKYTTSRKGFEVHVICHDVADYVRLSKVCVPSNIPFNRIRTANFLNSFKEVAQPTHKVKVVSFKEHQARMAARAASVVDSNLVAVPSHQESVPAAAVIPTLQQLPHGATIITTAPTSLQLALDLPLHLQLHPQVMAMFLESQVAIALMLLEEPTASSDQLVIPAEFAFLSKYKPHTLRVRICQRWGIIHAHVANEELAAYTGKRLTELGVPAQAVKNIFKK